MTICIDRVPKLHLCAGSRAGMPDNKAVVADYGLRTAAMIRTVAHDLLFVHMCVATLVRKPNVHYPQCILVIEHMQRKPALPPERTDQPVTHYRL